MDLNKFNINKIDVVGNGDYIICSLRSGGVASLNADKKRRRQNTRKCENRDIVECNQDEEYGEYKLKRCCVRSYRRLVKKLFQVVEKYDIKQLGFYTFTDRCCEDAAISSIQSRFKSLFRSIRSPNYVFNGVTLDVQYLIKLEYQGRGVLHSHAMLIFKNMAEAPKITRILKELWNKNTSNELDKDGNTVTYNYSVVNKRIYNINGLIDYFDKYDNANTLEETKAGTIGKVRTKFKKGDRVYLTSRNLELNKLTSVSATAELLEEVGNSYNVAFQEKHKYKSEDGKYKECVDVIYLERKNFKGGN